MEPDVLASGVAVDSASVTLRDLADDYQGDCGGGAFKVDDWSMTANSSGTVLSTALHSNNPVFVQESDPSVTRVGTWSVANCSCWIDHHTLWSSISGASLKATQTVGAGQRIAVAMPESANRGKAKIAVDGIVVTTVDTFSPSPLNSVVVYQTPPLSAGTHTVQVINSATAGRPRIDVDSFIVL